MIIKTFGSDRGDHRACDIVELSIMTKVTYGPHHCHSTHCDPVQTQPHFARVSITNLELADAKSSATKLQIDVLNRLRLLLATGYWQSGEGTQGAYSG